MLSIKEEEKQKAAAKHGIEVGLVSERRKSFAAGDFIPRPTQYEYDPAETITSTIQSSDVFSPYPHVVDGENNDNPSETNSAGTASTASGELFDVALEKDEDEDEDEDEDDSAQTKARTDSHRGCLTSLLQCFFNCNLLAKSAKKTFTTAKLG